MWQFLVGPAGGTLDTELTYARGRQIDLRLREPSTVQFTIDGRVAQAAGLTELATELLVLRDRKQVFRGFIGSTADTITADRHDITVNAVDFRGRLERLIVDTAQTYTTITERDIAWDLIEDAQAKTGGDLQITRGPAVDTVTVRTIDIAGGATIRESIDLLSNLDPGFDWDVTPNRRFVMGRQLGFNRNVILDYGGLVSEVTISFDPATYANAVRVSGDDTTTAQFAAASGIGTRVEGRYETNIGLTDVNTNAVLAARATKAVADLEQIAPAYTVRLRQGDDPTTRWGGLDEIGVGDTCRLVVKSGRVNVNELVRVFELRVEIGDSGEEQITLVLNAEDRSFLDRIRDQRDRIRVLERS